MEVQFQLLFLIIAAIIGSIRASTDVVYSQSISTCNITSIAVPIAKSVTACDTKITCPICNEDAEFRLIDSDQKPKISTINGLRVKNGKIYYLPQFPQLAKNLKFLSITSSELSKVTQQNLEHLVELVTLELSGNKIQSLEKDTFKFNKKIKAIRVSSNLITFVEPKIFNNLVDFQLLDFRSIRCYTGLIIRDKSGRMSRELDILTSNCNKRIVVAPKQVENCTKDNRAEILDYFDEALLSTASTMSNVTHQCTHSSTFHDSTKIELFLVIQTSIIAVLFITIFVIALKAKSSNQNRRMTGTQGALWFDRSADSNASANNDTYDEMPMKPKASNYEEISPEAMHNCSEYNVIRMKKTEEEDLYIDISEQADRKSEDFSLYAIPKKN
ncbi:unnamed protein product [Chironomus riparius]|uniref:Uncharacterized protein n=1 Tax=Chironomus riparius TaxID=315576 RepID=A0A9N9WY34_9DIPT|nr:unnamed protein product [Chironomus riparius]